MIPDSEIEKCMNNILKVKKGILIFDAIKALQEAYGMSTQQAQAAWQKWAEGRIK